MGHNCVINMEDVNRIKQVLVEKKRTSKWLVEKLVPIQENEYKELLRQAVAVIENARASVAFHLVVTASRNPIVRR